MSPVQKEVTVVSKRLGNMDLVVEKLRTFQESYGLLMQSHYCNPHDPRMEGKCLSVCVSVYIQPDIAWIFFRGGGVETGKLVVTGACGDRSCAQNCIVFHECTSKNKMPISNSLA